MVARGAGRVDALSAVQRERVKPERHRHDSRASEDWVDLDRQQVSDPPLSLRHDEPLPCATVRRPRRPHQHTPSRRVPPGSAPTPRRTSRQACSVSISARACPPVTVGRRAGSLRPAGRWRPWGPCPRPQPRRKPSRPPRVSDSPRRRSPCGGRTDPLTGRPGVMNPKPFSSLNHFTVPVAIALPPASLRAANAEIAQSKGHEHRHYLRRASCPT